jgi:hypothetical protein
MNDFYAICIKSIGFGGLKFIEGKTYKCVIKEGSVTIETGYFSGLNILLEEFNLHFMTLRELRKQKLLKLDNYEKEIEY